MNTKLRTYLIKTVLMIGLLTELATASSACITKEDLIILDKRLIAFNKAIQSHDFKAVSSFISFPLTDNHNHAITKRVFIEEGTYGPVINVRKILTTKFPKSMKEKMVKDYIYLDECNKHVIEKSYVGDQHGLKFTFKKIGSDLQLKLIGFAN